MLKYLFITLLSFPIFIQASFFGWSTEEPLSPRGEEAKLLLEEFDPVVEQALIDFEVPGIAIGVVVDGQIVYAKGFGSRNTEKKLPVTKETLFALGSCTKAFTTFAMGNLVDQGLAEWDDLVIDILPEFRLADQYATANVTIRDLLTHRTGIPRHEFVWYNSKMTKDELLKRIRYLQPSFDVRQCYQYGNLMYFITGIAMEKLAQKTWEDQIRERILNPLDMKNTNFSVKETLRQKKLCHTLY